LPVAVVRPFNTYGPRQSARAIIPTIIGQILEGKKRILLGNLTPTRDLTYVEDTVSGFLVAARTDKIIGETVNLGTGTDISIGDLAKQIALMMNKDIEIGEDPQRLRPAKSEVKRLLSNPDKMKRLTGWEAKTSLAEGLEKTIQWLSERKDLYKSDLYNI
jgi:nucleoside-diphosphate-sugar epimerase